MTSSVPTPDAFIESFPHSAIPKIIGRPTYDKLTATRDFLKENAASITSRQGGGNNGYLGIVVSPAVYANIDATAFVVPAQPPLQPVIAPGATAAQIAEAVREHTEEVRERREYMNVHQALKNQLIHSIEPLYLRAQRAAHIGFNNTTLQDLLQNLFTAYGGVKPKDLANNNTKMNAPWDAALPFETVIEQIEDAIEYADAGNQPYTAVQILNTAYNLVFNTGLFFDDIKAWNRRPDAEKTWDNFKTHFLEAYQMNQEQQNTMQAGFHAANAAQENMWNETAEALANLASAQAVDRAAMTTLTNTVNSLTDQLRKEKEDTKTLKNKLRDVQRTRNNRNTDRGGYCWSHGFNVAPSHNSTTCKNKKPGHKDDATRDNNMGGSQLGKE